MKTLRAALADPLLSRRSLRLLRRFRRQEDGVAAIEFGFIASLLLLLMLGVIDISNAVTINWKMTQLNRTVSDLTSQMRQVTPADLNSIFAASAATMRPLQGGNRPEIVVSSVVIDAGRVARVCWSEGSKAIPSMPYVADAAPLARGSVVNLPNPAMAVANTSLIVSTVSLQYSNYILPNFNTTGLTTNVRMLSRSLYFMPRQGTVNPTTSIEQVERVGTAMC
jgi:Flp pilus assembly protein TadG